MEKDEQKDLRKKNVDEEEPKRFVVNLKGGILV